jgi:threonine 3-dehydrogenase
VATLITGGTGFIGVEIVKLLLAQGEERPVVFSRNPSPSRLGAIADEVDAIAGDVGNFSHVLDAVKRVQPQVIYHLGSMLSVPSEADPASAIQTNAMGTFYVLEAARLMGVEQVIFSSSIGTYGYDVPEGVLADTTLQRPSLFYGATKVFGEHMGLFYRKKYGLDFRGIRYPSVVGPGVTNPGAAQYTSWAIEEPAKGNPFTIWVEPETRMPVIYIKEAAQATVRMAQTARERIKTVNYLVDGVKPTPSAEDIAQGVRQRIQGAKIEFKPDPQIQTLLDGMIRPIDDSCARSEWDWEPSYDIGRMIDDFLAGLEVD